MEYTNKQIREFLVDFFADDPEEFEFFCDDYYAEVKDQFSEGMSPKKRAHLLTLHVAESNALDQLLANLEEYDSDVYAEKASLLPAGESTSAPKPAPTPAAAPEPAAAPPTVGDDEPPEKPSGQDVFISYSRRDEAFIKQLYTELTNRGISVWYDRKNIGTGQHWPSEIVQGIEGCRVFLLSLSPDSTASVNVRKEVDLAQRYQKEIVPLIWRQTEIPVAMEYQLAGIQWIEFNEDATADKFEQLAEVLNGLLGGADLPEAASDKAIVKESTIPAIEEKEKVAPSGKPALLSLKKKKSVSPLTLGGSVISSVVTTFGLESDGQDLVNTELKWLFSAADHFLKVQRGDEPSADPIDLPIPPNAKKVPSADNTLLNSISDFDMQIWSGQIEGAFKRIKIHLDSLDILLERDAKGDPAVHLQHQIRDRRLEIVKILQELAELMNQAYGVNVTSPGLLQDYLQMQKIDS